MSITAEKIAAEFDDWSKPSKLRLHAGEMTAEELRTVRAILPAVKAAVLSLLQQGEPEGWREAKRIADLWFEPWGAAKAIEWEFSGDVPFTPENALRKIQRLLSASPLPPAPGAETCAKPDFEQVQRMREKRPSGESGYTDALWTLHDKLTDLKERDAVREAISVMTSSSRQAVLEEAVQIALTEALANKAMAQKSTGDVRVMYEEGMIVARRIACAIEGLKLATTPPAEGETK